MVMQINTLSEEDNFSQMLLQKKLLTQDALNDIQEKAPLFQQSIFQYIMQYRCVDAELLQNACAEYFRLPAIMLDHKKIDEYYIEKLLQQFIKKTPALPLKINKKNTLCIAICNPNDIDITRNLSFQLGVSIDIRFARYDTLYAFYNIYLSNYLYKKTNNNSELSKEITHAIFSDAIHRAASDIHFEPYQQQLRIRFRLDGLLHEIIQLSAFMTDSIISCVKIMAQLDIAIKRMPQDGRITFRTSLGFLKDCRVNTCPTIHGEKIVVRLLDANRQLRSIDQLGLTTFNQKIVMESIQKPQGLILVTGPTGSGKTITLYTLLHLLNQTHRNIATIEDPVEMQMDGINQTHINAKSGLTFSETLRALLRQDPDVIMLGEIRDHTTAEMAIRAAQTGHLVLSTLHTNSAADAITRLVHMGVAPFHLVSALTLIIAQRLVRKLCVHCKTPVTLSQSLLVNAGFPEDFEFPSHFFEPNQCAQCTDGFSGRMGVFELLPINTKITELILNQASHNEIAKNNFSAGHFNLWVAGLALVSRGITSLNEIYRVITRN